MPPSSQYLSLPRVGEQDPERAGIDLAPGHPGRDPGRGRRHHEGEDAGGPPHLADHRAHGPRAAQAPLRDRQQAPQPALSGLLLAPHHKRLSRRWERSRGSRRSEVVDVWVHTVRVDIHTLLAEGRVHEAVYIGAPEGDNGDIEREDGEVPRVEPQIA